MTVQCCKCKRFKVKRAWVLLPDAPSEKVSHGFCPACMKIALAEIQAQSQVIASQPKNRPERPTWATERPAGGFIW